MLVAVRCSHDAPHVEVARLPVVVIVIVGRGHSPLRMLLAPPLATLSTLPGTLYNDVRWRCPIAAWGRLPAS
jgi:hypothetical protein